jgi:hypothetical protein
MSYHLRDIPRGEYGEFSKIAEEVAELEDSIEQGSRVMALNELSDLVGAIQGYLDKHHPGMEVDDLVFMAAITARAFKSGRRVAR